MSKSDERVSFGFKEVAAEEKTRLVGDVFTSVANRYDLMNDLMSLGSHRLMKRMLVEMSGARPGHQVLDLAGGTGDIARLLAPIVTPAGQVVLADMNPAMLAIGQDRMLDSGLAQVQCCGTKAEALPFADDLFNSATIGFGLRNFTAKHEALRELKRVLKPGGALLVLEFSKPANPWLEAAYQGFQSVWPALGRLVAGDAASYRYLIESIRVHPDQETLKLMLADAGFSEVEHHDLLGGIAAIHRAVA
ncbi:MAG: class I SAM-dependent methyltransferase [Gammaproteobacteria bacterium]|nr:class I SAM-dependent methyltransferase [Gammaproteobacteria bacterium]MYE51505.1 class I SAM-dependent methyltransferase [Gammaproteobacteria bacterium]MYF52026.1 class I SAM-dependent methyltransferase [Gammaproteobacteria bacterium]